MSEESRVYVAIDLKSFYASVECRERGLSPLSTHLVVADEARTSKTICLAVSPSLKAYGIPGRPRLFEVEQAVQQINTKRRLRLRRQSFVGAKRRSWPEILGCPWTLFAQCRAWRCTLPIVKLFIAFICVILRRRIFMCIPLTKCLSMLRRIASSMA